MRVLFIGNSFTARNDVPGLIAAIAHERGVPFEHRLIWAGGASLKRHWNAGEAREALAAARWDIVVLQEQSTLPIKNAERFYEGVELFAAPIRAAGARMALYMTWARLHALDTQEALTDAYLNAGYAFDARVVPVGEAWMRYGATADLAALYDKDGSHPSLAGSMLAAEVFGAVLFDGLTASSS